MATTTNIEMLAVVARGLRDLKDQVVFVGGATVDLYLADIGGEAMRATDDVDCVINIGTREDYRALEEKLRGLGFRHPLEETQPPICRWKFMGITVDVMPTDAAVLGFSNRWYTEGMANAQTRELPDGQSIKILTLPYFLATKIEAFLGRGKGDFYGSPDIEDIITVLDRADGVVAAITSAPAAVKAYLEEKLRSLLKNEVFVQSITGHLGPGTGKGRVDRIEQMLEELTKEPS